MDKRSDLMLLEDLVRNYDSYKDRLLSPKGPQFLETLSSVKDFIIKVEEANKQWRGTDFKTTAIVEAPRLTQQLKDLYERSYEAALSSIAQDFKRKEKELSGLESYVFEKKKEDVNEIVELYTKLQTLSLSDKPKSIGKIEKYIKFSQGLAALDTRFSELVESYKTLDFKSLPEVALLQHDLQQLTKAYQSLVSGFRPKISFGLTIFDLPTRFSGLREISEDLSYLRKNFGEASRVKRDLEERICDLKKNLEYLDSDKVSLIGLNRISHEKIDHDALSKYPAFNTLVREYNDLRKEVGERIAEVKKSILEAKEITKPQIAEVKPVEIIQPKPSAESLEERVEESVLPSKDSRPFIRNETNFFDLPTYLDFIGFPPARYLPLMNIMLGKVESDGWIHRLELLGKEVKALEPAHNMQELDYLYHFYYALSEDMNRGNIDPLVSRNTGYREVARKTLCELSNYIKSSEKSLKLTSELIQAHQVNAPENLYNRR